jgi:hypothetical protein
MCSSGFWWNNATTLCEAVPDCRFNTTDEQSGQKFYDNTTN